MRRLIRLVLGLSLSLSLACGDEPGSDVGDSGVGDSGVGAQDVPALDGRVSPAEDASADVESEPPGTIVMTQSGPVEGVDDGQVLHYFGIPYAAPPLGLRRFLGPEPMPPWTEPLDASSFGPECPQRDRDDGVVVGEEDCLQLNIWAPSAPGPHPVMLWLHGGAFIQGSATTGLYDGSVFAAAGDVVVVSVNYRLGALGFLAHEALVDEAGTAGNYGLLDQVAALEWLQTNIASFGGDAGNVTVFGESAGGSSICALLGMPVADGLFHKAIIQSGGGCNGYPNLNAGTNPATEVGTSIALAAGCRGSADEVRSCLRDSPVETLIDAQFMSGSSGLGLPPLGPNVDGVHFPRVTYERIADGEGPRRPIITGSNADESRTFVASVPVPDLGAYETLVRGAFGAIADDILELYRAADFDSPKLAYEAVVSDVAFICSALSFARAAEAADHPVYSYHYVHLFNGLLGRRGALHGAELFPLFEGWGLIPAYTPVEADLELGNAMQTHWRSFAHTGNPGTDWPAYPSIRSLAIPLSNTDNIRQGRCEELRALGVVR
ncbi:MAG: carboxylesterase/lipase family protein [Polyangiales bacterium]